MSDVFISYSRKDHDFVAQLVEKLKYHNQTTWIDWADIPMTAYWWDEIRLGIEAADNFLPIISPSWLASDVCNKELEHARRNGKRIITVVHHEITPESIASALFEKDLESLARTNWKLLQSLNWVRFDNSSQNFEESVAKLLQIVSEDAELIRTHSRLLMLAKEWEQVNREKSFLLRGEKLSRAEKWLMVAESQLQNNVRLTELQRDYIYTSRKHYNQELKSLEPVTKPTSQTSILSVFRLFTNKLTRNNEKIFISYRRSDSADISGRIYDTLINNFGKRRVFFDIDTISLGVKFEEYISETLDRCSSALIVIGPNWLNANDDQGRRRIDNHDDYVRLEIKTALEKARLRIIPILVGGVKMPQRGDLPSTIRDLSAHNGTVVRSGRDFHKDMEDVTREIKRIS